MCSLMAMFILGWKSSYGPQLLFWVWLAGLCVISYAACELLWMKIRKASIPRPGAWIATKLKLWTSSARASLSRRWSNRGASTYWPIAFAVMCCAIFAYSITGVVRAREAHLYTFNDVSVVSVVGDTFIFHPANQREFRTRICGDYDIPPFKVGHVLSSITFYDENTCWSLDPNKHAGYYFDPVKSKE